MNSKDCYVVLYYLNSEISALRQEAEVKRAVVASVKKHVKGVEVVVPDLRPAVSIPNGNILYLKVKCDLLRDLNSLKRIETDVKAAVSKDQGYKADYKIASAAEAYEMPPAAAEGAVSESGSRNPMTNQQNSNEFDLESRIKNFEAKDPEYTFDRVILPEATREKILHALDIIRYGKQVFTEWGLFSIGARVATALNFYGPSGTGKSMTADAIAHLQGKKIIKVTYSDVESKYMGEGTKMLRAVFLAAERADAILFFDEADSLLSKRITNVNHGNELEINSMRSELLVQIEAFSGTVIFASNLIENYDSAFLTRLTCVEFPNPDAGARSRIWDVHLRSNDGRLRIPLANDINTTLLGQKFELSGRDIKRAVISACIDVVSHQRTTVTQTDLMKAARTIVDEKTSVDRAISGNKTGVPDDALKKAIGRALTGDDSGDVVIERNEERFKQKKALEEQKKQDS